MLNPSLVYQLPIAYIISLCIISPFPPKARKEAIVFVHTRTKMSSPCQLPQLKHCNFSKTKNQVRTPVDGFYPPLAVGSRLSQCICAAPQKSRKTTDCTDALSLKGKTCLDQQHFDHFLHQESYQLTLPEDAKRCSIYLLEQNHNLVANKLPSMFWTNKEIKGSKCRPLLNSGLYCRTSQWN